MAIVVPDEGELVLLNWMLRTAFLVDEPVHFHLFDIFYLPHGNSHVVDFHEASFPGYDIIEVLREDWAFPASIGGVASINYAPGFLSWQASSGPDVAIWGYFVTNEADDTCLWAEPFNPFQTVSTTVPVLVLPAMRLHSEDEEE